MEKMTNSKALAYILENCKDIPSDVAEKIAKMKEQVDKKSSAERKPTATQVANKEFATAIVEYLTSCDAPQTITDIMKGCSAVADLSNQRVSAIVRQLKDSGAVVRTEEKRKAYFSVAE